MAQRSKAKKIAIVYRPETSQALQTALRLAEWLCDQGITVYTQAHQELDGLSKQIKSKRTLNDLSAVIVLGGDGTYLNAARMLEGRQIPILGVNMGSLGFLTNTKMSELYEDVIYTLEGKMELRPRTMLSLQIKRKNKKVIKELALNDIVIERGSYSQMITLEYSYDRFMVCELKADGIVVATPTGSTAYNLAAGGPILHPETHCLVVTPVCPHSLTTRPMIFSDDKPLSFRIKKPSAKATISVDGKNFGEITPDDDIIITRSKKIHNVIRRPTRNYFDLLREKLKFGERD